MANYVSNLANTALSSTGLSPSNFEGSVLYFPNPGGKGKEGNYEVQFGDARLSAETPQDATKMLLALNAEAGNLGANYDLNALAASIDAYNGPTLAQQFQANIQPAYDAATAQAQTNQMLYGDRTALDGRWNLAMNTFVPAADREYVEQNVTGYGP